MPEMAGRQPDAVIACVGGGSNAMGISIPTSTCAGVKLIGVEAAGHGIDSGQHAAPLTAGQPGRRAARQPHLSDAGRERPDHRDAFDLGRPRLSRRRPRACLAEGQRARRVRGDHRRRGACAHSTTCAASKASSRRWNPAMRWLMRRSSRRRWPRTRCCWSICPAAATRTCTPSREMSGITFDDVSHPDHLRQAQAAQAQGADPVHHRRRSRSGIDRAADARAGRGRRRRDRTRRAVLRPDGRRPDHPARFRARAEARHDACSTCSTWCANSAASDREHAGGADGLCQSDRGDGLGDVCASAAPKPASMAC